MPCFHPLEAFITKNKNDLTGKRVIRFQWSHSYVNPYEPIKLPCGQCAGCRLERSRQWAMRCMHESSLWQENAFITLTYNDEALPPGRSLYYPDFQKFMKRFRKRLAARGQTIRFYMCGEYGENLGRPHYHALIFNWWPEDAKLWKRGKKNDPLYTSQMLSDEWGLGYAVVGRVTFESAAYVARYVMKKRTGDGAQEHYEYLDEETGEVIDRLPEFTNMSRRPGIASDWFDKWSAEVYPVDYVVINGRKCKPPKYYDRKYELIDPEGLEVIKEARVKRVIDMEAEFTKERLRVKEQVLEARLNLMKRNSI